MPEPRSAVRATPAIAHKVGAVRDSETSIRAVMIFFVIRVPDSFSLTCEAGALCDLDHTGE